MKQSIVAWMCILGLALGGCPGNHHEVERADNAAIAAQHQIALEVCLEKAVETNKTDGDKAYTDYVACADAAGKKFGLK